MEADFTLVPIGGLGNRLYAICSAIAYCRDTNRSLKILWFKDPNLNCPVGELFSVAPGHPKVELKEAGWSDFILRDNPRRRNFRIPKFFQRFLFDRRIYDSEVYRVASIHTQADYGPLDRFKHIFMVSYWHFHTTPDMWRTIVVDPRIEARVREVTRGFTAPRTVGVHIRRTDNTFSIRESPTELFIRRMEEEIERYDGAVAFYLASDSEEVKKELTGRFGARVLTSSQPASRNNKQGIIDAFVELNVLSRTDKIYASSRSSFSELAHYFSGNDFEIVKIETDDPSAARPSETSNQSGTPNT